MCKTPMIAILMVSATLSAAQIPGGAVVYLGSPSQGQQLQARDCDADFYKMLVVETGRGKAPLRVVNSENDAAYSITCTEAGNLFAMMGAFLHGQRLTLTKALVARDNKTKRVVWTSTCVAGSDRDVTKCLAERLRDAPKGPGEDANALYGNAGTPLHIAALAGELDVVEYLVDRGATVNSYDSSHITPLHRAAEGGHIQVAEFLLSRGADVNVGDNGGVTPLHVASGEGHLAVAKFLVEHGADINSRIKDGSTPLHVAASSGRLDVVEFLVSHGANVNARGEGGLTPLHVAVFGDQRQVVAFLATHGADLNARNDFGQTPLELATARGYHEVVASLTAAGAKVNAPDR